jgi:RHS repeat-associated protein
MMTEQPYVSCADIQAGNNFTVQGPNGNVTFQAQGEVVLTNGFSVGSGASFAAGSGSLPTYSDRTFGYQAPQYFLTSATLERTAGSWGTLDWTYDKIGNRLSEDRSDGLGPDTYQYTANTDGGNTPLLDHIDLAVMGTRNYAWDAAGNLDSVAPGGNFIDFTFDDASRLAAADRTSSGGDVANFLYDGRGFLRSAGEMAGDPLAEAASVEPLYDSSGLLHALRHQPTPTDPVDTTYVFYLAGRPVSQLEIDGMGAESWQYLTTDHLGTPLVATDQSAAITWEGGFQPFGTDYQAGTGNGASDNGIPLRLPGQWVSDVWADATSGAGVYYNLGRWVEPQTGRFTRPDPLGLLGPEDLEDTYSNLFIYSVDNPLFNEDPSGRVVLDPDSKIPRRCKRRWRNKILPRLLQLASNRQCTGFFCRQLNANLPSLLTSTLPIVKVYGDGATHGGHFDCPFSFNVNVGHGSFCSASVREAVHVVLHETAHYADCFFNASRFPRAPLKPEEGCAAETACFGSSIGQNCSRLGYPYKEP